MSHPRLRVLRDTVRLLMKAVWHPVVAVSTLLIAVVWVAAWHQIASERAAKLRESIHETARIAVLLEQNVARVAGELDRIIQFIRESNARNGYKGNWPALIENRFTVHDQVALVSIIDRNGILLSSTTMLHPKTRIDLSEREHFRYHTYSSADQLYISKPVLGRVSGKWTIQFTRRLDDANGQFDGVIVVSLDPALLAVMHGNLDLGNQGGFALLLPDNTVAAATGKFADSFNKILPRPEDGSTSMEYLSDGSTVHLQRQSDEIGAVAERPIRGYPLSVVVASRDTNDIATLRNRRAQYTFAIFLFSFMIMLGSLLIAHRLQNRDMQVGFLAKHDTLTGLANRSHFTDTLQAALNRPTNGRGCALHLLDLDGFKTINDTYGHPVGDRLLIAVAERLRRDVRASDVVARLGGDEFAVLQQDIADETQAQTLAKRLCDTISRPYELDATTMIVGASIGIETTLGAPLIAADLMARADLALYAAKADGRGTFRIYTQGMQEANQARATLERELRIAVEKSLFELHYQPIVTIDGGNIAGYEALVRWRHPQLGLVPPMQFIPLAETTGLMVPIGAWVLNKACSDMAKRPGQHKVAVNISPVQFRDAGLIDTIKSALATSGLHASRLEIEITESTLMHSNNLTIKTMEAISALGIKIAIDDFGTGYSSLSYLQKFPISCIKIDRSFVTSLAESNSGSSIIRAITRLADCLGMSTVAEGVETQAQFDQLTLLGCTEAQGYLFSAPKRAEEILPALLEFIC